MLFLLLPGSADCGDIANVKLYLLYTKIDLSQD